MGLSRQLGGHDGTPCETGRAPVVVVAMDSFKGSATSAEVEALVAEGVWRACSAARVCRVPIADGGEGTVAALHAALGGELRRERARGPLGAPVEAAWALLPDGTAVLETASAAGIGQSGRTEEDALAASTFGLGQLVRAALDAGARRLWLGLGGSATSDGGAGLLSALGVRLLDAEGHDVRPGLAGLADLVRIDASGLDRRLGETEVVALTDVQSPLVGTDGAVHTFGPQKGLPKVRLAELDGIMARYASLVEQATGVPVADAPGAGAAGGLGAALLAFLGARLISGIDWVLDAVGLDAALADADLAITGEGRMDAQTAFGKAPVGVSRRARAHGVPVVAVVGSRAEDLGRVYEEGVSLVVPLALGPCTLAECMGRVGVLAPLAGETAMRAYLLGR